MGTNGLAFPIGLFAAAAAGVPFVPLNYRLSHDQLHDLLAPLGDTLVVAEGEVAAALAARGHRVLDADRVRGRGPPGGPVGEVPAEGEAPAVLLYTSGTTAAPKAAVLRHRHLTSYVIGTVEFAGAGPDEAVLVSVPPYHVAGLANLLSNLYLGRRIVYLAAVRRRRRGSRRCAGRGSPTPWSCRRCWPASATCSRPTAAGCPACGRCPTAGRARRPRCSSG